MSKETIESAIDWIDIAQSCQAFHTLPRSGGVMNQRPKEMKRLFKVLEIINTIEEAKLKKEASG